MMKQLNYRQLLAALLLSLPVLGACKQSAGPVIVECGGGAGFVCPLGTYCDLGSSCGGFDDKGVCRRQPIECPPEHKPVCGCDEQTYASPCYAAASGASIAYEGSCIKERSTKPRRQKLQFPDSGRPIDGSSVEDAGDIVQDQYRPLE